MIRTKASLKGKLNTKCAIKGKVCVGVERIYPEVEDLVVTPSSEEQVFKADNCNYGEVKVLGDEDLQASNIKQGVEIFGVTGSLEELTTETKEGINNQEEIITNQETTLEEINQVINDKILVVPKYKPRALSFFYYTGTDLDYEVNNVDTKNLTTMKYMFQNCTNLISLDLSGWDVSNVTSMGSVFAGCTNLTSLNLDNFDTSNVTSMGGMFNGCRGLTSLDVSNFDTSNVTDMSSMFSYLTYNTKQDINLDLSNFNTEKVTTMYAMFNYCYYITKLDLSSFYTPNLTNTGSMFQTCMKLTYLDIRNFTFDKVTSYSGMFNNIPKDCLIIVKGQTEKDWVLAVRSDLTNVKTIAELEV